MSATDRVAGVLQGTVDVVQDVDHVVRSGDKEQHPHDRAAAAHERWMSGQAARNQFEKDHFAAAEANLTQGMRQLEAAAEQAMAGEANREAGQ